MLSQWHTQQSVFVAFFLVSFPVVVSATKMFDLKSWWSQRSQGSSYCEQDGWEIIWSDEFNGAELDTAFWTKEIRPPGNSRTRLATGTLENVYLEDGALVLKSNGTWNQTSNQWEGLTSGAVDSKGKVSFQGPTRVCVSAKLPGRGKTESGCEQQGQGIWPAHWLMPDDASCWPCHGEIDIMEMINADGNVYGYYHWCNGGVCGDDQSLGGQVPDSCCPNPELLFTEYHEYAVQYGYPNQGPIFSFEGTPWSQVDGSQANTFSEVPYYMILNTAVGGNWPGPPNQDTIFPTYHYIDWIRWPSPNKVESFKNLSTKRRIF